MQQPIQPYDVKSTNALKILIQKNNLFALPLEEVRELILSGADPNAKTPEDFHESTLLSTALSYPAFTSKNEKFISFLLQYGADPNDWHTTSPLQNACTMGCLPIVQQLLEKKAQVTAKSTKGASALLSAVQCGYAGIVQVLLKNGAVDDIDFFDAHGDSPMSVARERKLQKIITLFEKYQKRP